MKLAQNMPNAFFSKYLLLASCLCIFLSSCANTLTLGQDPAQVPPKLELSESGDDKNLPVYRWDRPLAFAKLRPDQKAIGDAACLAARADLLAIGYHPHAQDEQGRAIHGGGYLCTKKSHGDQPDLTPPQLVTTRGLLGWDRPSAFGYIPPEVLARGIRICKELDALSVPLGFHPNAKDKAGQIIDGGGFFCGKTAAFLQSQ